MITRVTINNFKKLENISFDLSESVVVIGPNNSGKSTLFHALCLWETGVVNYLAAYQKIEMAGGVQKSYLTIGWIKFLPSFLNH